MGFFFWAAVALVAITLVGHGIWVFVAELFRLGQPKVRLPATIRSCPQCGEPFGGDRCRLCNWPGHLTQGDHTLEALTAIRGQIEQFLRLGLIDQVVRQRLLDTLDAERQRVTKPAPAIIAATPTVELIRSHEPEASNISQAITGPAPLSPSPPPSEPIALPSRSPEERVRSYMTKRDEATAPASTPGAPAADMPRAIPPRTRMADLLAAFMEEKNIRWGELVGGLLIVCCSIALVISFWAKIAERPFLKFFVFNGVTAALFGLGLYAAHRWKLRTTSRAVLAISMLLVPLNFLAIAAFSQDGPSSLPLTVAGEAASFVLFATLCYFAGRMITASFTWLMVAGVILPSIVQLVVRRWVEPATGIGLLLALGAAPLIIFAVVNGLALWRQRRLATDEPMPADETLTLLGTSAFAALLPLGLLLFKTGRPEAALHQLAMLVSGCGLTPLAVGLFLWQRLTGGRLSGLRTAALSIAVAGAAALVAGVVLAWPNPAAMLPTALFVAAVLAAIGMALLPEAHLLAVACLALAYLIGLHLAIGRLHWQEPDAARVIGVLVSGRSGQALVPFAVVLFAFAAVVTRWSRRAADGRILAVAAAGVATISTGLVSWFGFAVLGDPLHATWIYALFGIATSLAAARLQRLGALWIGVGLILASCIQGVVYLAAARWPLALPWGTAIGLDSTLMVAALAACQRWGAKQNLQPAGKVFLQAALGASAVMLAIVAAATVGVPEGLPSAPLAIHWFWLAAIWLGLALLRSGPLLFAAFQSALTVGVWFGVGAWLETQSWFAGLNHHWLEPWVLQVEGIAISILSIVWILFRWSLNRISADGPSAIEDAADRPPARTGLNALLNPGWPAADSIILRWVLIVLVGLSAYAAWPGVAQELSPRGDVHATAYGVPSIAEFEFYGISAEHAAGWGSWLLTLLVAVALVAELTDRRAWRNTLSLLLTLSVACPLAGSWWGPELATASATRWFAAMFMVAGSAFVFVVCRLAHRVWPQNGIAAARATLIQKTRAQLLLFLLGGVPAVVAAWYAVQMSLSHTPVVGTVANSLFGRMGSPASYAGPVVLAALVLVAYGIWERSGALLLLGGIVGNVAATTAYLLGWAPNGLPLDAAQWTRLAQLNAIVAAACALVWIGVRIWSSRRRSADRSWGDVPLLVQIWISVACNAYLLVPAWLTLVVLPSRSNALAELADVWGWTAGLITAAAIFGAGRLIEEFRGNRVWPVVLAGAAVLAACTACRWDTGNWLGYHMLMVCHLSAAWVVAIIACFTERTAALPAITNYSDTTFSISRRRSATILSLVGLAVTVALAVRALDGDPAAPWWTLGALITQILLAVWLACWSLQRGLLFVAAILINLAASIWWLHHVRIIGGTLELVELVEINIIALALPTVAWLWIELRSFRPNMVAATPSGKWAPPSMPLHRFAARCSLTALGLIVALRLGDEAMQIHMIGPVALPEWLALAATAVAVIGCFWDTGVEDSIARLYFLGLIAVGVVLDQLQLEPKWLWWGGDMALAAYTIATSCLWWLRAGLRRTADWLRIPRGVDSPLAGLHWLVPLNCTAVMLVVALSFGFVLEFDDYILRLVAAKAVVFQMVSVGLLARGERRWQLQYFALILGVLGGIALGWAGLAPGMGGMLLNRAVVVAAALAVTAVVYGLGLAKLLAAENEWLHAARRLVPMLIVADACAILFVLGTEGSEVYNVGQVTMIPAAMIAVGVMLIGLCVACLAAAVLPGRDPLGLSERGRQAYVYAAEVLLVLLLVHFRLTKPEWFHGPFFKRYWPLIIEGIAFVGVGVGEWFRRRRWTVLGDPLETTGALLPLLPVLGFWIVPTEIDYSFLLLGVGLLYAGLSVARKSFGFGLLAMAAANGSLWFFLDRQDGYRLLDHPQLWLIPPALCILIATHLNRRQLSAPQVTAIRYGASIVMYVSSTADIFLQGVAHAPWLPLVLGGLSILGVFAGIILRVRAFLILGTSFLLLSLLTIIWYAAVDLQQTWLWSATGIVTGVLILVVFALFEKKRQTVLDLLERFKKWQP